MRVGILTLQNSLNYGGVLQCWALKRALEKMGHDVVIVDRWLDRRNANLLQELAFFAWRARLRLFWGTMFGRGSFGRFLRTLRTIRFVRNLGLSQEHFVNWSDLKNDTLKTKMDVLVVGSDQVWHCGDWGDPRAYLLEGAPKLRAISYAASFGLTQLPEDWVDVFKRGLPRFSAISCREREGVDICRRLGFDAEWVVDPTLLLDRSDWNHLLENSDGEERRGSRRRLVCYFLGLDIRRHLPLLERFAEKMDCEVLVLANQALLKPLPTSFRDLTGYFKRSRVKVGRAYGPREFVRAFASATWTLTDSFHAIMFSEIFNRNMRFISPATKTRKEMFARILEFGREFITGNWLSNDLSSALASFEAGEQIRYVTEELQIKCSDSLRWLQTALNCVK